jgi:hypothetical protein
MFFREAEQPGDAGHAGLAVAAVDLGSHSSDALAAI